MQLPASQKEKKKKALLCSVGKFRFRLIELTSFKPKLLIRSIMNNHCSSKQTFISCQYHAQPNSK